MKKSTLITTIAMIVVVVVALSTATYAWFTSAGATYATQTITTTAAAELTVVTNETILATTSTEANFTGTNLLPKTFVDSSEDPTNGLRKGLWAPATTAALNGAAKTGYAVGETTDDLIDFIQGTQDRAKTQFTVTVDATKMSPDLIRVSNNATAAKTVTLTIYVGASNKTSSYVAGRGVSFYIDVFDGSNHAKFNSAYSYLDTSISGMTSSTTSSSVIAINETNFKPVADSDATARSQRENANTPNENEKMVLGINHSNGGNTPATGYTQKQNADAYSLAGGAKAYYYAITITLGSWTAGQSKNIYLYNWLDGAFLTDSAAQADIDICYAFAAA